MKTLLAAAMGLMLVMAASTAHAESKWNKNHPRRHEVNGRLNNQHNRVKDGVEDGKLNKRQAGQVHKEDRNIRREERRMARKDGGHLTKGDQRKINRQENRVSRQINRDESKDSGSQAPAAPATPAPTGGQ